MSTDEAEQPPVEHTAERAAADVRGLVDRPGLRRVTALAEAALASQQRAPTTAADGGRRPAGPGLPHWASDSAD